MTDPQPGLLTGDDIDWDVIAATEDPPPPPIREPYPHAEPGGDGA